MTGCAWVTLATNDSYSLGALVLAHSLKKAKTVHKLAVLVTPAVSQPMKDQLGAVFDLVKTVDVLDSKDEAHLALLKRPELGVTFTKIHCWRLTEFSKCVFLDADTLVVRNCDELFDRDEFSAAPDVSWPDCFNSGVFVYKPSVDTFNKLLQFAVETGSFDGGDQGLLNQFFSTWATEDIKKHLPFVYNLTSVAVYSYIPAFKQYGADARIVHFIGTGKPWLQQLDPVTRTVTPTFGAQHMTPLLQRWWDLFCENVHPNLNKGLDFANGFCRLGASSNTVDFVGEPWSSRSFEPCGSYREAGDCRQFGLPYQSFDVLGSSGELLNLECVHTDAGRHGPPSDEHSNLCSQSGGGEGRDIDGDQPPTGTEGEGTDKPRGPFDYDTFFPDSTCVSEYLQQNVLQYRPYDGWNDRAERPDAEPTLPRFLTIPENDRRQRGNCDSDDGPTDLEIGSPPKNLDSYLPDEYKLSKSKSMTQLVFDVNSLGADKPSPTTTTWMSQPNVVPDPNKKYIMPRLRPLAPRDSPLSKSALSLAPKVTLYTEFLMSSDYRDPVDLPVDKVGFVEAQLRRTKSDADVWKKVRRGRGQEANAVGDLVIGTCRTREGSRDGTDLKPETSVGVLSVSKHLPSGVRYEATLNSTGKSTKMRRKGKRQEKVKREQVSDTTARKATETVDDILKRLASYSRDYLHYFGDIGRKSIPESPDERPKVGNETHLRGNCVGPDDSLTETDINLTFPPPERPAEEQPLNDSNNNLRDKCSLADAGVAEPDVTSPGKFGNLKTSVHGRYETVQRGFSGFLDAVDIRWGKKTGSPVVLSDERPDIEIRYANSFDVQDRYSIREGSWSLNGGIRTPKESHNSVEEPLKVHRHPCESGGCANGVAYLGSDSWTATSKDGRGETGLQEGNSTPDNGVGGKTTGVVGDSGRNGTYMCEDPDTCPMPRQRGSVPAEKVLPSLDLPTPAGSPLPTAKAEKDSKSSANDSPDGRRLKAGIAGAIAELNLGSAEVGKETAETMSPAHQEYLRRQNWETGNIDYMGKDSFDNIWSKICQTMQEKPLGDEASKPKLEVAASCTSPANAQESQSKDGAKGASSEPPCPEEPTKGPVTSTGDVQLKSQSDQVVQAAGKDVLPSSAVEEAVKTPSAEAGKSVEKSPAANASAPSNSQSPAKPQNPSPTALVQAPTQQQQQTGETSPSQVPDTPPPQQSTPVPQQPVQQPAKPLEAKTTNAVSPTSGVPTPASPQTGFTSLAQILNDKPTPKPQSQPVSSQAPKAEPPQVPSTTAQEADKSPKPTETPAPAPAQPTAPQTPDKATPMGQPTEKMQTPAQAAQPGMPASVPVQVAAASATTPVVQQNQPEGTPKPAPVTPTPEKGSTDSPAGQQPTTVVASPSVPAVPAPASTPDKPSQQPPVTTPTAPVVPPPQTSTKPADSDPSNPNKVPSPTAVPAAAPALVSSSDASPQPVPPPSSVSQKPAEVEKAPKDGCQAQVPPVLPPPALSQVLITQTPPTPTDAKTCGFHEPVPEKPQPQVEGTAKPVDAGMTSPETAVVPYCDVFESAKNTQKPAETRRTEAEHRKDVEEVIRKQGEAKGSQYPPIPLPESPTEGSAEPPVFEPKVEGEKGQTTDEGKQKKGMVSKLLEMVGVSSKDKKESQQADGSKSVFYDGEVTEAEGQKKPETSPETVTATAATDNSGAAVKPDGDCKKSDSKADDPKLDDKKKTNNNSSSSNSNRKNKGRSPKPPEPKKEEGKDVKPDGQAAQGQAQQQSKQKNKGKGKQGKNSGGETGMTQDEVAAPAEVKGPKRKSPSPSKLSISEQLPGTAVTLPTPTAEAPSSGNDTQPKNAHLLTVSDVVPETPPVPQPETPSKEPPMTSGSGAKGPEVQKQDPTEVKATGESGDKVTTDTGSKKPTDEAKAGPGRGPTGGQAQVQGSDVVVEELKVTTEEERKKHKSQIPTSKLSDQILKAIPPPRRKAISESKGEGAGPSPSSSGGLKKQEGKAQGDSSGKSTGPKGKSAVNPVPPPRNRSKPRQQQPQQHQQQQQKSSGKQGGKK